jgi:hypothetical protein
MLPVYLYATCRKNIRTVTGKVYRNSIHNLDYGFALLAHFGKMNYECNAMHVSINKQPIFVKLLRHSIWVLPRTVLKEVLSFQICPLAT